MKFVMPLNVLAVLSKNKKEKKRTAKSGWAAEQKVTWVSIQGNEMEKFFRNY